MSPFLVVGLSLRARRERSQVVEHDRPQPHQRVGAPGPPGLAASGDVVDAQPGRGVAHPEVGRQEDVGVAERPHRDVVGGPRPDAGQRQQRGPGLGAVGAAVEPDVAAVERRGQTDQRAAA